MQSDLEEAEENLNKAMNQFGELIDKLDNLAHAGDIPMPAELRAEALKEALPELVTEFKAMFVSINGDNPWEE